MKNEKKGYITRYIRFKDEKEIKELMNSLDFNDKEAVLDIIYKIYLRKDLAF